MKRDKPAGERRGVRPGGKRSVPRSFAPRADRGARTLGLPGKARTEEPVRETARTPRAPRTPAQDFKRSGPRKEYRGGERPPRRAPDERGGRAGREGGYGRSERGAGRPAGRPQGNRPPRREAGERGHERSGRPTERFGSGRPERRERGSEQGSERGTRFERGERPARANEPFVKRGGAGKSTHRQDRTAYSKRPAGRPFAERASRQDTPRGPRKARFERGDHAEQPERAARPTTHVGRGGRGSEDSRRRAPRAPEPEQDVAGGAGTQKLHKVLAQAGLGSRRDMEQWITQGQVTVNGAPATLGARVSADDRIEVAGRVLRLPKPGTLPKVLLYHKPEGEITSHDDPAGRPTVFDKLPPARGGKWLSIGRLDFNTCGLLLFTTSGELANRMMHPRYGVEREYAVRVMGQITAEHVDRLLAGVEIGNTAAETTGETEPAEVEAPRMASVIARCERVELRGGSEGSNEWCHVVLKEGRNREVRRMFEALGLMVSRLMRVRFGPVELPPRLKRGQYLEMTEEEVQALLTAAGVPKTPEAGPADDDAPRPGAHKPFKERRPGGGRKSSQKPRRARPGSR